MVAPREHSRPHALRASECGHARTEYTAKYARPEDVAGQEEGRDGNDSMSARSDGFLSSSDEEDEPPTTGEAEM